MATSLLTQNIWKEITKAAKKSKKKSFVAVAYFGKDGAKMLPLKKGSKLVVDASEGNIKAGQTDPGELLQLYNRGVKIYSYPSLHAKTYVIGSKMFLGSSNVSHGSAEQLQEAVVLTSERSLIESATKFICDLCSMELGDEQLTQLTKLYRPPKFHGGKRIQSTRKPKKVNPNTVSARVVRLEPARYEEGHELALKEGRMEANKRRINKSRHFTEEFNWEGNSKFKRGEIIIQILDDGRDEMVLPPSIVIFSRSWQSKSGKTNNFVFVERLDKRGKNIRRVKQFLNKEEKKAITRNGFKSQALSSKLISLWN